MSYMEILNMKKKRVRRRPQMKWTEDQHKKLLNFLLENMDIEKPTAQLYYIKCLEQTGLDATPDILRCKVRYWRLQYQKAEECRNGLDTNECSTIKKKLHKICPFYDQLTEVFGKKYAKIEESTNYSYEIHCDTSMDPLEAMVFIPPSGESPVPKLAEPESTFAPVQSRVCEEKCETVMAKNRFLEHTEITKNAYYQQRLRIEQEKLELEKTKVMQEFELKKMELAQKQKLAEIELAQKERLAEMELRFKYNKE